MAKSKSKQPDSIDAEAIEPDDSFEAYFFSPQSPLDPKHPADRALATLAGHLLRRFAEHLPGFAESSYGYLWQNFLAVRARWEYEQSRICVHLTRPPLYVVLNMTRFGRGRQQHAWLDPRPLDFYLDA